MDTFQIAGYYHNMELFILTITFFSLAIFGIGIGVFLGSNKPIKGSCGGTGSSGSCTTCGGEAAKCGDTSDKKSMHYGKLHTALQDSQHKH